MPEHTRPARGMRDFLPDDVRKRDYVIGIVRTVYQRYGFEPLETPALENIETLTGKYGEEGNKLIFKVLRRGEHEASGETDLALRYDLTVPLARVVAEHRGRLPRFFKRYQIQPVWRADRPARGRFREFYQCDVDAIGSRSMVVEAELCAAVSDVLHALGFESFFILLNHRGLLRGMLETFGVPDRLHDQVLIAIDKRDKIGRAGVATELEARGIPAEPARRVLDALVPEREGPGTFDLDHFHERVFAKAREHVGDHAGGLAAIAELEQIQRLSRMTSAHRHLVVDLTLARGLSYYTGAIMEIVYEDLPGSLGGGGRYDGLIGIFLGEAIPACGFSLGLERILVVMTERGMFPADVDTAPADVLVTLFEGEPIEDALGLAAQLRSVPARVEVYPEPDRLGKQFKYASSRGIRLVTVVGSDERQAGTVTVKDMDTGAQTGVPRGAIAGWLGARLKAAAAGPRVAGREV
ncbi:MAG TPA: histidine--tRNA ligase [Vicinamibacterales bacterium]|nr:histidine--tRNA ligase [Vicinamibacterales bacterium]